MKTIYGDLIHLANDGDFDIIVHGCNCFCTMGAGIAKVIKAAFPQAYEADLATPRGDRAKLGTCSFAEIERDGTPLIVVNAYTQFDWRGSGPKVDYDAVRSSHHRRDSGRGTWRRECHAGGIQIMNGQSTIQPT